MTTSPASLVLDRDTRRGLTDYSCLHAGGAPRHAHIDWVQAAQRLSDADCDELIELGLEGPVAPSTVVGEEHYPGHRKVLARKILPSTRTAWIFELLCELARELESKHFALTLTNIAREPQYVEYVPGRGEFGWHHDYSHGLPATPRKVTIIIQLSRPDEYEGGLLQTFGVDVEDLPRERGTIVAFPSFVVHRITPVTRGLRKALVTWIAGPRIC
jgi:hypothetical protein